MPQARELAPRVGSPSESSPRTGEIGSPAPRWLLPVAVGLSLVGPLLALPSYFPDQDGPGHLFVIHALQAMRDPASPLNHFFYPRLESHVTYVGTERLVLALARLLPLAVADRLVLMLLIAAFPLSIVYFLRRVNPSAGALLLAGPLLQYNWILHMGFLNLLAGYALLFFTVGYAYPQLPELEPARIAVLGTLLLAIAVIHPFALVFTIAILGLAVLLRSERGRRVAALARLAVALIPPAVLVAYGMFVDLKPTELIPFGEPIPRLVLHGMGHRFGYFFARLFFSMRPWVLPIYLAMVSVIFFGGWYAVWRRTERSREARVIRLRLDRDDTLLVVAAAAFVAYLIVPYRIGQAVAFVADRMPIIILVLFLGWLPTPQRGQWARVLPVAAVLVALAVYGENASYIRQWDVVLHEYTAAEPYVARGAKLLPIFFDSRGVVPAVNEAFPIVQASGYYSVERDAVTPYSLASYPHLAIGYRRDVYLAELPNPGEFFAERREREGVNLDEQRVGLDAETAREQAYARLLDDGLHYDYLLIWRPVVRFVQAAHDRGYVTAFAQGHLLLLRPPGHNPPVGAPGPSTPAVPWRL